MTFGAKLRELRQNYGLTQTQLAMKLDTSKSNISKYESNAIEPNLKTLVLISDYFNVSIDSLLHEDNLNSTTNSNSLNLLGQNITELNILNHRIRNLREDMDLTQKELAEKVGLTPKMISFYENNQRTPPADILIRLSNIFHVSTDYLLGQVSDANTVNMNNLTLQETGLLNYFKEYQKSPSRADQQWGPIGKYIPGACVLSDEEKDVIEYYNLLSLRDKRWIMGQMIDQLKREEEGAQGTQSTMQSRHS